MKRLCGDADNLLLAHAHRVVLELRLDVELPLALHDLLDSGLAEAVPLSSQAGLAYSLKGLVDEDAAAEAAFAASVLVKECLYADVDTYLFPRRLHRG